MASTTETTMEKGHEVAAAPPPPPAANSDCLLLDVSLRMLLLASSIVAVVVMVTANETKLVYSPLHKEGYVPAQAKFRYSPAFVYFVAALSVAGLYSIITGLVSLLALTKGCTTAKTIFLLAIYDMVMLGIVASATGTAGGVGYVGLKGNSHVNWKKICDPFGKFCRHVGASIAVSLLACVLLVLLVLVNAHALYRRAEPKC